MDRAILQRFLNQEVRVRTMYLNIKGVVSEVGDRCMIVERRSASGETLATYCVAYDHIEAITQLH